MTGATLNKNGYCQTYTLSYCHESNKNRAANSVLISNLLKMSVLLLLPEQLVHLAPRTLLLPNYSGSGYQIQQFDNDLVKVYFLQQHDIADQFLNQ